MTNINPSKLEELITSIPHTNICFLSSRDEKNSKFSYTSLYDCEEGEGNPEVRGFKNGHYAGVLLMPRNEMNKAYFTVFEGDYNFAQKDMEIILRLINQNAMIRGRRQVQMS